MSFCIEPLEFSKYEICIKFNVQLTFNFKSIFKSMQYVLYATYHVYQIILHSEHSLCIFFIEHMKSPKKLHIFYVNCLDIREAMEEQEMPLEMKIMCSEARVIMFKNVCM